MKLPEAFETPRLAARPPLPSDAQPLFEAYTADPTVSRYMMWRPHADVATTEVFIAGCIDGVRSGTRFPYVLFERAGAHAPIGMLEARPHEHRVDLGYVLKASTWGRGYMPEAIGVLAALALAESWCFRVQAFCDVDNRPSQRALEKAGFQREGRLERWVMHPNVSDEPRACFMYARCR